MNPRAHQPNRNEQAGLSLVEILVAITISSLLIAGVIQIFASNKSTYRMQEGLGRMQENARFALDFMARDVREAGYLGCARNVLDQSRHNIVLNPPAHFAPETGIQGWEFTGTGAGESFPLNATDAALDDSTNGDWVSSAGNEIEKFNVLYGSDILRVWHATGEPAPVSSITSGNPTLIRVDGGAGIDAGDFVLMSDCNSTAWMQVCDVSNTGDLSIGIGGDCGLGNDISKVPTSKAADAEVLRLMSGIYFIGKRNNDEQSPPSLYYVNLNRSDNDGTSANPQELVEGVDTMQVLYGEDTDADGQANTYRSADQVTDWQQVIAVKIGLLMRTVNEVDTNTHGGEYDVNGTTVNLVVEDRRPRKVFTTTILLRNRAT
jgi:type IV pilus assembly protein PilW